MNVDWNHLVRTRSGSQCGPSNKTSQLAERQSASEDSAPFSSLLAAIVYMSLHPVSYSLKFLQYWHLLENRSLVENYFNSLMYIHMQQNLYSDYIISCGKLGRTSHNSDLHN
jgi:hypothetical protein